MGLVTPLLLFLLLGLLFFALHHVIRKTPPVTFDRIEIAEGLARFSLEDLETFHRKLEDLRAGKSIRHMDEKNLSKIRAYLSIYTSGSPALIAKLIAMIVEDGS